jgi:hypothetical protein
MITFKSWDKQHDCEIYEIQKDGYYYARLLVQQREGAYHTITFDSRRSYSVDDLAEMAIAIKHEFGQIDVKIGGIGI